MVGNRLLKFFELTVSSASIIIEIGIIGVQFGGTIIVGNRPLVLLEVRVALPRSL